MPFRREIALGTTPRTTANAVRDKILRATTRLMARQGVQSTSVRDICKASNSNVASIKYHFGSKELLVREMMYDVVAPVYSRRIALLEQVLAQAAVPSLRGVLDALVRPLVEAERDEDGGRTIIRLLSHTRTTPDDPINIWLSEQFDATVHHRFIDALQLSVPHLSRIEVAWRYEFVRGSTMHALNDLDPRSSRLLAITGVHASQSEDTDVLHRIIDFSMRGFAHPDDAGSLADG